jgi:protease-4
MKRRKVFWGIVLFLLVGIVGVAVTIRAFTRPPEIKPDSVLEVEITGNIVDGPVSNPVQGLLGGARPNIYDLRRAIDGAAGDSRIRALVLVLGPNDLGWGGAEEIYSALQLFRKSGKPIHAIAATDFVGEKEYYLALAATRILVNPGTGFMINGLYAETMFFRKALDKLNIKPEYIQFKEYKSAGEMFTRKEMSPDARESLEYVVRDIENRFVQEVAASRKKTPQQVRAFMDMGVQTAPEAKQSGFIDETGYRQDLDKSLEKAGVGGKDDDKLRLVSVRNYVKALDFADEGKTEVGVVFASGTIAAGDSDFGGEIMGGDTVAGYLRRLRKDEAVKAVILRVNSPGGSAVGSDVIWREVAEVRAAGKPVVVSMGDVAGSGGYYIAMGADRIIAQPSTITGSIGVIFGKLNARAFFDWLGVTFDAVKISPNANILSLVESLTPEQEKRIRAWMSLVYDEFVSKAAQGRKKPFAAIEPVAHGRIWSGAQAKDRALVDALGGFNEAVAEARRLAKIPTGEKLKFVIYPKKKSLMDLIFSGDFPFASTPRSPLSFMETPFFKSLQEPHVWMVLPDIRIY